MHRQQSVYGPDAEEYRPERWLEGDKALMEKHFMSVSALPFTALLTPSRPPSRSASLNHRVDKHEIRARSRRFLCRRATIH